MAAPTATAAETTVTAEGTIGMTGTTRTTGTTGTTEVTGMAGIAGMTGARASASARVVVEARGVEFSYRGRRALAGVSFRVLEGELFGFFGPNGGGKSTLFRLLATLARPASGSIELLGLDLVRQPAEVRRRLGVVFQSPSLDLQLTCGENLLHQGHLYGLHGRALAERIAAVLGRFGLADRWRDRAAALSGGLRRRLEIAKALLHRPRLLLLDEPSTGLDPGARSELWVVLESLRREGVTVLLTTHFMEEGERCDRLVLLDRGRVVAEGTPAALEQEIGGDVVTLTGPDPERLARELAERYPELAPAVHDGAVRLTRQRAHEFVARLVEALPGRIDSVTVARPTLEDVFLRHTGSRLGPAGPMAAGLAATGSTEAGSAAAGESADSGAAPRLGPEQPVAMDGGIPLGDLPAGRPQLPPVAAAAGPAMDGGIPLRDLLASRGLAVATLWRRELVRFARQPSRIAGAIGTPLLFWALLGSGLSASFRLPGSAGGARYLEFFFPGTLALVLLFAAIFSTISVIEDRDQGFLQGVLAAPVPRSAIAAGKVLGGATLAWLQAAALLALAPLAGIPLHLRTAAAAAAVLALLAASLTALGFAFAWAVDSVQGFHSVMSLVLLPMWLLSGAFFPLAGAPLWLAVLMRLNPLTYGLGALRWGLYGAASAVGPGLPAPALCLAALVATGAAAFAADLLVMRRGPSA
ncbi:MAG TPA: ATP-binding cassette domain-containing protein [Thermoanaerobaculia bacterium]|nr:ATP-binding cassette domain-containing protein [Thermoanaerobaculia bacterium]